MVIMFEELPNGKKKHPNEEDHPSVYHFGCLATKKHNTK